MLRENGRRRNGNVDACMSLRTCSVRARSCTPLDIVHRTQILQLARDHTVSTLHVYGANTSQLVDACSSPDDAVTARGPFGKVTETNEEK